MTKLKPGSNQLPGREILIYKLRIIIIDEAYVGGSKEFYPSELKHEAKLLQEAAELAESPEWDQ